jgi:predicted kinase
MDVYVLVGAPGCGKTTWRKTFLESHPDVATICPDEYRAILGTGEGDQSVSREAFEMAYKVLKVALHAQTSVIIDATNMHRKGRKRFLQLARGYGAKTTAIVFEVDKATLMERNAKRGKEGGRVVPEDVIDMMLGKYQRPEVPEFDEVTFI